ncbi:FimV family protein [Vogesella amnigena]|uniref:FimV family protein n=1 Tax=Vogesella amnigena TaxID=1507449 RepID=A0ABV7TRN7_9NEIS
MRLKALSIALALGMLAPLAHAGLGEIRVLSAAGEPFLAEIPVLEEPGMLAPYASLASTQQYPFLDSYTARAFQLKILTVEEQPGRYVIRVMGPVMSADEALDFALELAWAAGREVRAYHAAPRAESQTASQSPESRASVAAVSPDSMLAFGEAQLLSRHGEPLLAEIPLHGEWPEALADGDFLFRRTTATPEGLVAVQYHHSAQRRWLTLQGLLPLQGDELVFVLETRARGMLVARSYRLPLRQAAGQAVVARQPGLKNHAALYRVQAGDTLSSLVHGMVRGLAQRNQLALQIVRDNPHAFVDGNPNHLLAGALLQLPQRPATRSVAHGGKAKPAPVQVVAKPVQVPPAQVAPAAPVAAPAQASAPLAATASAEEERQRIQRLHAAQQRINKLEQEIQRIADSQHSVASAPQPEPNAQHDSDLMAVLDDWVLTGVGGASVLSLLAWALWRRRRQHGQDAEQEQLRAEQAAAAEALKQRTSEALLPVDVPSEAIEVTELPASEPPATPEIATTVADDSQMLMLDLPAEPAPDSMAPVLAAADIEPAAEAEPDAAAQVEPEPNPDPAPAVQTEPPLAAEPDMVAPPLVAALPEEGAGAAALPEAELAMAAADVPLPLDMPPPEPPAAVAAPSETVEVDEVLAEADVHLLYDHRDEAIQVLRSALQRAPQAEPLRHRLLQLLADDGDRAAFEAEALDALASGGANGPLWGRVLQLGRSIDPTNPLYGAPATVAAVAAPGPAASQVESAVSAIAEEPPVVPATVSAAPSPVAASAAPPSAAASAAPAAVTPAREAPRQVRRVAANQPVAVAELAENDAETAALAQLYREMGDTEMADALLKGSGN